MAKHDWIAGENIEAATINEPYFLASGVKDGADLVVYATRGGMRFSGPRGLMVHSGGPQAIRIANAAADAHLFFYVRSSGAIVTSGTTATAIAANGGRHPGIPFWDAEPIGRVYTGASFSTANLVGPWNQPAHRGYDLRGWPAVSAAVNRIIYDARFFNAGDTAFTGGIGTFRQDMSASGISYLTWNQPTGYTAMTKVNASVSWVASGEKGDSDNETLRVCPTFRLVSAEGTALASFADAWVDFSDDAVDRQADPWERAANHFIVPRTTSFCAVLPVAGSANQAGVRLEVHAGDSEPGTQMVITAIAFSAEPDLFASQRNER